MQLFSERKTSIKAAPKDTFQPTSASNMQLRNENSVLDLFFLFKKKRLNIHWGERVEEKHLCCYFQGVEMLVLTTEGVHLCNDGC